MKLKVKGGRNLRQSDFVIIAVVTILVIFGVVMVFSASYYKSINESWDFLSWLFARGLITITTESCLS